MRTSAPATLRLLPGFARLDEGFGSAYERYAVGCLVESMVRERGIQSVAEWPANGVLGVPGIKSLPLALAGAEVTLLNPDAALLDAVSIIWRAAGLHEPSRLLQSPEDVDAAPRDRFDLVWSFCAFEHAASASRLASAMLRASRRYVLVFVQNAWGPGVHLHRLQHALEHRAWDHGAIRLMRAGAVARALERGGARIEAVGGCDLPPWPDLDVKLPRFGAARSVPAAWPRRVGPSDPVISAEAAAAAFLHPMPLSAPMQALVAWHDNVELRLPERVLLAIAHHPWVLARTA